MANTIIVKRSSVAGKVPLPGDLQVGELAVNLTDQKIYSKNAAGSVIELGGGAGSGDVVGPASATDNALARFDGTTGKLIQNSQATIDDFGNLDAPSVKADFFDLDTTATPAGAVGREAWDDGSGTAVLGLKGGNVTYYYGQQEFARVYNGSGATLTKGQVVYIVGAQGNRIDVRLARANVEATSANTIGFVAETIAAGAEGWVQTTGPLYQIDTSALTAGQVLYLSPTTAGAYTTTKPAAPNQLVVLGFVERVHATVGSIYVKVDNGYELDELHDVQIVSPASGNTLIYDASNAIWKNASLTAGAGISVTNGAGSITIANTGVTSVSGSAPINSSGGATPAISLASAYGDTQNPYGSKTANTFLAAPNGSNGVPSFRAIVAADVPTLNQNTTGTAGNVTGIVAIANGGSGASTAANARTNFGATTVGGNLFTLANPSAITFLRVNADNTVSTLDAASFRSAIGAGTSSTTGTVTSVSGTGTVSGLTLSGTVTTSGNITLGGTLAVTPSNFSSQTANTVLAAPNGSSGVPTFRALVAADIPTLNQNTTGTAANVTGTVAIANGGTGATTRQEAMDALAGAVTAGQYLRGNGTDVVMSAIQAADVPTLNQNTTGNAATATTAATANALNTANSYTGTGFTATTAQAYIVANRTSSGSGQVGYNWAQGGTNLWWNYVDTGNTTLSWYNSVANQNVMTLTTSGALNTAGAITQNGSQVLTAGNFTSYAPSLTGSGASGTWGINITGNAATATTADQIDGWEFRNTGANAATNPDSLNSNGITYTSTGISLFGQNDGALYSQAYSGEWQHQIFGDYRTGQIAIRGKNNGTWQSWRTMLDSSNYTSYAPSLTGSGASGTWGINISGGAAKLTTGRTISLTGDVTYTSGSFDGSANVTGTATLANSGVTAGTYTNATVTVDAKGRVTSASSGTGATLTATTGSAPYYGARAWANFNGVGSVTVRASANIQSIVRNSTGTYTVNFLTAMPDRNYAAVVGNGRNDTGYVTLGSTTTPTASAYVLTTYAGFSFLQDGSEVYIAFFR